jgi:hypothetical protein
MYSISDYLEESLDKLHLLHIGHECSIYRDQSVRIVEAP